MGEARRGQRPRLGTCVYCGQEASVEDDHVFPLALWRESDRQGVPFIRVPACKPCNNDKSRYDDALRDRVELDYTSSDRREHRDQVEKIARSTKYGSSRIGKSAWPLVTAAMDDPRAVAWPITIPVDPEPFYRAVEYVIRGLYFHHTGRMLTKGECEVRVELLTLDRVEEFFADYTRYQHYGGGLGDTCTWSYDLGKTDPTTSLWVLFFKDGVVFRGLTKRTDRAE